MQTKFQQWETTALSVITRNVKLTNGLRCFSFYLNASLAKNMTSTEVYLNDFLKDKFNIIENKGKLCSPTTPLL